MKSIAFAVLLILVTTNYVWAQTCSVAPVTQCFQSTCGFNTPVMTRRNTACKPCGEEDIGAKFTQCVDGKKSLFYFWKPPATCVSNLGDAHSTLPAPVHDFPCDFHCHAGEYVDLNTRTCQQCDAGSYADSEDVVYDSWTRIPSQMRTFCTSPWGTNRRCSAWRMQGSYADSGNNNNQLDVRSTLELSIEVVREESKIEFDYQYNTDDDEEPFFFTVNGDIVARLPKTNESSQLGDSWTHFSYDLTPGFYKFEWYIETERDIVVNNLASLFRVVIDGVANTATTCTKCQPGYFSDGSLPCAECPLNTFSNITGAASCTPCPDFYITNDQGSTSCVPDPFAICKASDYYDEASACVNGQRTITTKIIKPVLCKPNHPDSYRPAQVTRTESCPIQPCHVGQIRNAAGICEYCPKGYYINETFAECQPCAFGSGTRNVYYIDKFTEDQTLFRTGCFGSCRSGGWRMMGDRMDSGYGNGWARTYFELPLTLQAENPLVTIEYSLSCDSSRQGGLAFQVGGTNVRFIPCSGCNHTRNSVTLSLASVAAASSDAVLRGAYMTNNPSYDQYECDHAEIYSIKIEGSSLGGAEGCLSCGPGKYADEHANCDFCAPGTYSTGGAYNCTKCAPGTFSVAGASSCIQCRPGTVPNAKQSACVYPEGPSALSGPLADIPRRFNWTKTSAATYGAVYNVQGTGSRYYLNLGLNPNKPHQVCGNAIACSQQGGGGFGAILSLGDLVSVAPMLAGSETGLRFTAESFNLNCNNNTNVTTTTIKFICNPSVKNPSVVFERVANTTCAYQVTVTAQDACPQCTEDDYFMYRGQCVDGKQTIQYVKRLEPARICYGGFQQDLNPQSADCNPFTVYIEGPVWALLTAALVILILLIIVAAVIVTGVVLFVKNRQLYSRLTGQH